MGARRPPGERQGDFGHANAAAKRLRADMSATERRMWAALRKLEGIEGKFRRQAPIGPYVADFVHHGAKLVVEFDGPHHDTPEGQAQDRRRDDWLRANGFRVLRIANDEVWKDEAGVLARIREAVEAGLVR